MSSAYPPTNPWRDMLDRDRYGDVDPIGGRCQLLVLQPDFVIIGVEGVGGSGIRGRGLGVVDASVTRRAAC